MSLLSVGTLHGISVSGTHGALLLMRLGLRPYFQLAASRSSCREPGHLYTVHKVGCIAGLIPPSTRVRVYEVKAGADRTVSPRCTIARDLSALERFPLTNATALRCVIPT